jgi:hypothetical protein
MPAARSLWCEPGRNDVTALDRRPATQPQARVDGTEVGSLVPGGVATTSIVAAARHPSGLPDAELEALFTRERPIILDYPDYPALIYRLTYRRVSHASYRSPGASPAAAARLLRRRRARTT